MSDEYLPAHELGRAVRPATDKQLRALPIESMFRLALALNKGRRRKAIKDALLPLISNRPASEE
jgi:hypothetical protein